MDVGCVGMAGDVVDGTREGPEEVSLNVPAPRAHVMPQYMWPGEVGRNVQKAHRVVGMVDDEAEGGGMVDVSCGIGGVPVNRGVRVG
jgi:hypothetical protein